MLKLNNEIIYKQNICSCAWMFVAKGREHVGICLYHTHGSVSLDIRPEINDRYKIGSSHSISSSKETSWRSNSYENVSFLWISTCLRLLGYVGSTNDSTKLSNFAAYSHDISEEDSETRHTRTSLQRFPLLKIQRNNGWVKSCTMEFGNFVHKSIS